MKSNITVLIVEDSLDDFYLLEETLTTAEEVEVVLLHVSRLAEAVTAAAAGGVDVAIIDLALPDSFGLDTFDVFHRHHPLIPTIIMTGALDREMAMEAVRRGAQDYLFKGENTSTAIIRSILYAIERQRLMTELKEAMDRVKQLEGMLPICSICKNIRDDKGYWNSVESYITHHSMAVFSHSICPDCARKHYQEFLLPRPTDE